MPVPKRKTSKSRRDKRQANKGIKAKTLTVCKTCKEPVVPHQVCHNCGYYKGIKVIRTKEERMHERGKAKQVKEEKMKAMHKKEAIEVKPKEQKDLTKK